MCLTLREDSKVPYNKSKFRWKVVKIYNDEYEAPYYEDVYNKHIWNHATMGAGVGYEGFHVFVTREDARLEMKNWSQNVVVKKIEVDGFLRSGTFEPLDDANLLRSETWKRFKFVN